MRSARPLPFGEGWRHVVGVWLRQGLIKGLQPGALNILAAPLCGEALRDTVLLDCMCRGLLAVVTMVETAAVEVVAGRNTSTPLFETANGKGASVVSTPVALLLRLPSPMARTDSEGPCCD